MLDLKSYFKEAVKQEASDLHLVGGEVPTIRIEGELKALDEKPLDNKDLMAGIEAMLTKEQQTKYSEEKELD